MLSYYIRIRMYINVNSIFVDMSICVDVLIHIHMITGNCEQKGTNMTRMEKKDQIHKDKWEKENSAHWKLLDVNFAS